MYQFLQQLQETDGGLSTAPKKAIAKILNFKACRSAIMFGTNLSKEECQELLERLSTCKFPFQCAHGKC